MSTKSDIYNNFYAFLFLFLFFSFQTTLYSQSSIPRLLENLENMEISRDYVDTLNELAFLYLDEDLIKAQKYTTQACELSQKLNYPTGKGDCFIRKGIISEYQGDYQTSISHYEQALIIRKLIAHPPQVASVYNNIGLCYYYQGKTAKAIENFNEGLNILKNQPTVDIKGHLFINLSDVFLYKGKYKQAVIQLDSSKHVWNILNDKLGLARTNVSKGNIFLELEDLESAEDNFQQGQKLYSSLENTHGIFASNIGIGNVHFKRRKYKSALEYFQKSFQLKPNLGIYDRSSLEFNIGSTYKELGDIEKALISFQNSLDSFQVIGSNIDLGMVNFEMGNIYYNQKDIPKALFHYKQVLDYGKEEYDPVIKGKTLRNLSLLYTGLNQNDLAIRYSKQYANLRDSISQDQLKAMTYEFRIETEQRKGAELSLQITKKDIKDMWRNGVIVLLTLLGLLGYFISRSIFNRQQKEKAFMEIDDLLREQELEIAYAKLDAKDATQKQIGQDLHDRLGVILSTIKLYFQDFSQELNVLKKDTSQQQHKTLELIDEAVDEVRRISHDMQSGVLKKFGLVDAVKNLAEKIQDSNQIKITVNVHGLKTRIPNNLENKIYKIIQELISNVLKHAKAQKITIYLHRKEGLFNLIVEDDGIGFSIDKLSNQEKEGIGLKNITYRVSELDGKCHFDSQPQKGTSVIIDIPLPM